MDKNANVNVSSVGNSYLYTKNMAREVYKTIIESLSSGDNKLSIEYTPEILGISIGFTKELVKLLNRNKNIVKYEFIANYKVLSDKIKEDIAY